MFLGLTFIACLSLTQVIYPYVWLAGFLCLTIFFIVLLKPIIGIYLMLLLYPLGSISLFIEYDQIRSSLYFEEMFSFMLLLVMILKKLSDRHQQPMHAESITAFPYKWIFFLLSLFIIWSTFTVFRSQYFFISLIGLWRFISCFIIITFLVLYLDTYEKFIDVLKIYCFVALIYGLSAVYATNFVFDFDYRLNTFMGIHFRLFNQASGVLLSNVGMLMGVGLASKHDLAMLLTGGIFFALLLMKLSDSLKVRFILLILVLLYITIIYQVFSKISIAGMFLATMFLCFAVSDWRKLTVWVVAIFIILNIAGFLGSSLLKTTHMKNMESTQQKIESSVSESEYEPSSLAGRKLIWRKTIERIIHNNGLGSGPDSLRVDMAFAIPHGHNFLLTLIAEYGLPGAALIIIFLLVIAESSHKSIFVMPNVKNNLWILQAVFVAASLHALFVYCFDMPIYRKQLWFMLGLLMASINVAAKCNQKEINHLAESCGELKLVTQQRD